MTRPDPLPPADLYRRCDPGQFRFATTEELAESDKIIGQERAMTAVRFGVSMRRKGYNLFALGPSETLRHTIVREYLERVAADAPVPADWCYVHNFADPQRPRALKLPPGRAARLSKSMNALIEELRVALRATFEGDEYRTRRQIIEGNFRQQQETSLEAIQETARAKNIALMRTPAGLVFAPMREGEVLSPEEFNRLPKEEQERIKADVEALQKELQESLQRMPVWEKELRQKIRELNREFTKYAVGHLIGGLRDANRDLPLVTAYLDAVERDIVDNALDFLRSPTPQDGEPTPNPLVADTDQPPSFRRYKVNVIVDQSRAKGAPVVYEDIPSLSNLIGRIEHLAQFGALITDFNLIKAGALHRANGGYLLIDARKLLMEPLAYEELKRAMRAEEIRIDGLAQRLSIISTVSLEPEPIPLDVKIVLVGDRMLYHLLSAYDPDFEALFKVPAEFNDRMDLTPEAVSDYAQLIAKLAQREKLRPLDPGGVARVIEHATRLADDSEKLSVHIRNIIDLLREADYWAEQGTAATIAATHVQQALDARIYRLDWVREQVQEQIRRGTVLIDTAGAVAGQVNGLSVLQVGSFAFGRPSRITARVRIGKGEVIDIERQVELGGPLHSKGVLILSGFLGARFAADRPLTLSATLVFEQSYGGVDGDSASSAELYALLSALANLPIKQNFAVTGSVNQMGQVQAIGGVNEKIEGFFDICAAKGLTGEQGVLIPASNVKHLMLRADVVEAAAAGRFHIFPIARIEEGIEVLTGTPAGAVGADGKFPSNSVFGRVEARLAQFAEAARRFGETRKEGAT
ncbi:MAG TPA: ATP-binding protein [Alphaproteobacteria bacterium]|jgi:lon-related putative ATP-dependent protease|nr:ATP-binding protein [Alphaproteobacteria bacterium]